MPIPSRWGCNVVNSIHNPHALLQGKPLEKENEKRKKNKLRIDCHLDQLASSHDSNGEDEGAEGVGGVHDTGTRGGGGAAAGLGAGGGRLAVGRGLSSGSRGG